MIKKYLQIRLQSEKHKKRKRGGIGKVFCDEKIWVLSIHTKNDIMNKLTRK